MRKKGSNKESKWSGGGSGLSKHRKSGVASNHANSIQRTREVNKKLEEEQARRNRLKPESFSSVSELMSKRGIK